MIEQWVRMSLSLSSPSDIAVELTIEVGSLWNSVLKKLKDFSFFFLLFLNFYSGGTKGVRPTWGSNPRP